MQDIVRDDRFICPRCGKSSEWQPEKGYRWTDWVVVCLIVVGMGSGLDSGLEKLNRGKVYPYKNVSILKKYDDYHFLLKIPPGPGLGAVETQAFFCQDYKPFLVEGCFLKDLTYEDKGGCWSVAAPDTGYHYLTDAAGNDVNESGEVCWRQ